MKSEENGLKKGQRFGRWTLLDKVVTTAQGEKKHLCRCDCGTERYVLERSLKSGGSLSCGCLRRERAQQATAESAPGWERTGHVCAAAVTPVKQRPASWYPGVKQIAAAKM